MFSRNDIVQYVNERHLEDGGYFFARIVPSSQLDTYLAVEILTSLQSTIPIKSIIRFWKADFENGNIDNLCSAYLAAATLQLLHAPTDYLRPVVSSICNSEVERLFTKKTFHFHDEKFDLTSNTTNTLFLDVVESEVKNLFYYVKLMKLFNLKLDTKLLFKFIHSLQNDDGGYGSISGSDISSTYYILAIFNYLHEDIPQHHRVEAYLLKRFSRIHYLEEYYWVVWGLHYLGLQIPDPDLVLQFVQSCYLGSRGFIRSQFIGAANIEYTAQAVSLITLLEKQLGPLIK